MPGSRASQPLSHVCAELPGPEEEGQVNPHILVAAWLLDPRAGAVTDATMYPRERGSSAVAARGYLGTPNDTTLSLSPGTHAPATLHSYGRTLTIH